MSTNPLLDAHSLPPFAEIKPEHVVPAIETLLTENREAIEHWSTVPSANRPPGRAWPRPWKPQRSSFPRLVAGVAPQWHHEHAGPARGL